jgi:DnaJ-class molecular chaperone
MGMKRDDNIGNLIIEFTIIFPETLSKEKIDILKENM